MKAMNMPAGAIRQKMMRDGLLTAAEIDQFFNTDLSLTAATSGTGTKQGNNNSNMEKYKNDKKYENIIKLRNLKVPEIALRHRMRTDGFTTEEIDKFFIAANESWVMNNER